MSVQSDTETSPTPTVQITYADLVPVHHKWHGIVKKGKNKGKERSQKQVENDDAALNQYLKHLKPSKSLFDPIGDEFGTDFETQLTKHLKGVKDEHIANQKRKGKSIAQKKANKPQVVSDRETKLRAWHKSYKDMLVGMHLPDGFKASLKLLISDYMTKHPGTTFHMIGKKCGIAGGRLIDWADKKGNPGPNAKDQIAALEKIFSLPAGLLWNKLPYRGDRSNRRSQATPHRELLALKVKDKYIPPSFPPAVQEEWKDLVKLHDSDPTDRIDEGLEQDENSVWRERPDGVNSTERFNNKLTRTFFGFLLRDLLNPADQQLIDKAVAAIKERKRAKSEIDSRTGENGEYEDFWKTSEQIADKRGKQFSEDELSIALLSDAHLTNAYMHWRRARTGEKFYNSFVKNHLQFCSHLVHPKHGYLTKRPEFGKKLPQKIETKKEWVAWCKKNHKQFNKYLKMKFGKSRDPFEPIEEYIEWDHPIEVLEDMADVMEANLPSSEFSPLQRAIAYRDLFLSKFLTVTPLREHNFSIMKIGKHLYQKDDGSWHIRFSKNEFKNEKGAAKNDDYDVPLPASLWPYIEEYLNVHRLVLYKELWKSTYHVDVDNKDKDKDNPMRLVMNANCQHIFLPHPNQIHTLIGIPSVKGKSYLQSKEEIKRRRASGELQTVTTLNWLPFVKGIRKVRKMVDFRMTEGAISELVLKLTQLYIPNCVGFGPHSSRHIIGTELAKNEPYGIDIAAGVLHITKKTAEDHYARTTPKDKVKRWLDHYERLKERRKSESGAASRGKKTA